MDIKITPARLFGKINAIASKSYAHRIITASALADKKTRIYINAYSEDIDSTIRCVEALGAKTERFDGGIDVYPIKEHKENVLLDCGESGSTARFLIPAAAGLGVNARVVGSGRLPQRPFLPLVEQLTKHGVSVDCEGLPMNIAGRLSGGIFEIEGGISSQYITGLMLSLPLTGKRSEIVFLTPPESEGYIDITVDVLKQFGISVVKSDKGIIIPESEYKSPEEIKVEGDWSNSAFWIGAGIISGQVITEGLNYNSVQGDKAILKCFDKSIIDAGNIPDIVPILAVIACAKKGKTKIVNAQRLRYKESDRLKSITDALTRLGADIKETDDGLEIYGNGRLSGGICDGYNDHRIVMSCAIASCICENDVIIKGAQAVNKSYPAFFDDFKKLGGKARII